MAELGAILASGDIDAIRSTLMQQHDSDVVSVETILAVLALLFQDGTPVSIVETADAANNSIFFDATVGRLRYKSTGGIALQFKMELV